MKTEMIIPKRVKEGRGLTLIERTIAATTVAIAVGAVALSITGSARANEPAALPVDGPVSSAPSAVISHTEFSPAE